MRMRDNWAVMEQVAQQVSVDDKRLALLLQIYIALVLSAVNPTLWKDRHDGSSLL
jgi:UTP:GlnB (protein PII) uridylyltransferase